MATEAETKLSQLRLAQRMLKNCKKEGERELLLARIDKLLEDYHKLLTPVPA